MKHPQIVSYINQRLSLRKPQLEALKILDDLLDSIILEKSADIEKQLSAVQEKYNKIKGFDRDFMSLCFALATGVGKTRLMGAMIAYLHKAYNINNFMVIAPNLTIYDKLVTDFTPGTPKYVFTGIDVFHQTPPTIVTGDNYQSGRGVMEWELFKSVVINIFNISKLTAKDKGHLAKNDDRSQVARIRRMSEQIGESYFDYLASRKDLVIFMDESHRYRADAGASAINELKPVLGIELTATPRTIHGQKEVPFGNIIQEYNLAAAMKDGLVKEPAIATRKNFDPANHIKDSEEFERLKLNDGILIHEQTRQALKNYAFNNNCREVKPFMLVVAENKAHADELEAYLTSSAFQNGFYADKTIKVYSGQKAEEEALMIGQLLEIEKADNKVEIVIHVNKLSEGWDVTNLFTIVPLRAANSVNLVEQSIGRGLRLPYGKRTGDPVIDTLTVVSHDNYSEIIKKARDGKLIMMKSYIIGSDDAPEEGKKTVQLVPVADVPQTDNQQDGSASESMPANQLKQAADEKFANGEVHSLQDIASKLEQENHIPKKELESAVQELEAVTIEIPRIFIKPKQAVFCHYADFELNTAQLPQYSVDDRIIIEQLSNRKIRIIDKESDSADMALYRQMLLSHLVRFNNIDYDGNAALIQKLVTQCVEFLQTSYGIQVACNLLRNYSETIAYQIKQQIIKHAVYKNVEYEVTVCNGYFKLMQYNVMIDKFEQPRNCHVSLEDGEKSKIRSMVFNGFKKCLYSLQKFDSDSEREFACILEKSSETLKWFKPSLSNFSITWKNGNYQPDFIVETTEAKYICEVKADKDLNTPEVQGKMEAALVWCQRATEELSKRNEKPWFYLLIPHSKITLNLDFSGAKVKFRKQQGVSPA